MNQIPKKTSTNILTKAIDNWDITLCYVFPLMILYIAFSNPTNDMKGFGLMLFGPIFLFLTLIACGISIGKTISYKMDWMRLMWLTPILLFILRIAFWEYFQ